MKFMQNSWLSLLLLLLSLARSIVAWTTIESTPTSKSSQPQKQLPRRNDPASLHQSASMTTRRTFLPVMIATVNTATAIILGPSFDGSSMNRNDNVAMAAVTEVITDSKGASPNSSSSSSSSSSSLTSKLNLSDDELIQIIRDDIVQRQFLVTGNITKSIYASDATFTDEIDTYGMDQWMIGTQRLFVGDRSQVRLVNNNQITFTSPTTIEFLFDEDLMFNLPIIKPIVSLTGKVILTRDPNTGYIKSYREYWDQDVATVLKSAKF